MSESIYDTFMRQDSVRDHKILKLFAQFCHTYLPKSKKPRGALGGKSNAMSRAAALIHDTTGNQGVFCIMGGNRRQLPFLRALDIGN